MRLSGPFSGGMRLLRYSGAALGFGMVAAALPVAAQQPITCTNGHCVKVFYGTAPAASRSTT